VVPDSVLRIPTVTQPDDFSCWACCAMSVGRFYGIGPDSLDRWKAILGTNPKTSTNPIRVVEYLMELGAQVRVLEHATIDDLRCAAAAQFPCILPIQEYGLPSKRASFKYGHAIVSVGVIGDSNGSDLVVAFDPSIENLLADEDNIDAPGLVLLDSETLLEHWWDRDESGLEYDRVAIVVAPPADRTLKPRTRSLHAEQKRFAVRIAPILQQKALSAFCETSGGALVGSNSTPAKKCTDVACACRECSSDREQCEDLYRRYWVLQQAHDTLLSALEETRNAKRIIKALGPPSEEDHEAVSITEGSIGQLRRSITDVVWAKGAIRQQMCSIWPELAACRNGHDSPDVSR